MIDVVEMTRRTIRDRALAERDAPVLLMVSGGSDSTALAYIIAELAHSGNLGPLAMLHVNHQLRGSDSDGDAAFAAQLACALEIEFFADSIDVAGIAQAERGNVEAVARRERYRAAREALSALCGKAGQPCARGRIFVAHTADDRIENFYMRSIVGTGPGGFRSMRYLNGQVARPLLDVSRQDLRDYIAGRGARDLPVVGDERGMLWREDATNEHTDRFRAYVRHEIVPRAMERNPSLAETLTRTMNLIGDEDDMLEDMADDLCGRFVAWLGPIELGCVVSPLLAAEPVPMQRRVATKVIERFLGAGERIDAATVEAVVAAFEGGKPKSGYVANVQGNLAVSANKRGVRIEPMAAYRMRRKRV